MQYKDKQLRREKCGVNSLTREPNYNPFALYAFSLQSQGFLIQKQPLNCLEFSFNLERFTQGKSCWHDRVTKSVSKRCYLRRWVGYTRGKSEYPWARVESNISSPKTSELVGGLHRCFLGPNKTANNLENSRAKIHPNLRTNWICSNY